LGCARHSSSFDWVRLSSGGQGCRAQVIGRQAEASPHCACAVLTVNRPSATAQPVENAHRRLNRAVPVPNVCGSVRAGMHLRRICILVFGCTRPRERSVVCARSRACVCVCSFFGGGLSVAHKSQLTWRMGFLGRRSQRRGGVVVLGQANCVFRCRSSAFHTLWAGLL